MDELAKLAASLGLTLDELLEMEQERIEIEEAERLRQIEESCSYEL